MQAIILSAGLGVRLRPITETIPKVMVPIGGKPLLEHHIEQLKKHGVCNIFINLYYLPDVIKNYFGDGSKFGVNISYKYEKKILGTAGGIKNFENEITNSFFVVYGDVLNFIDYGKFREYFDKKLDAIGVEIIGGTNHPHDSDLVEVDKNLLFCRIYRKPNKELPKSYKAMKAVFLFKKEILDYIPRNSYYEIDHQLLPDILSRGLNFYGYESEDYLKDIGTIERYQEAREDYLKIRDLK
jgi:NDP-sugar pyrophosphorylase family protein